MKNISNAVEETKDSINKLHLDHHQRKTIEWLSPQDPSTNYNKALQQRHKGSGQWLLRSEAFEQWKTRPNSFLRLHGIPGCGKTILSSTIIEDLNRTTSPSELLLYFYFDFSDTRKQSLDSMIRSLISQLYYRLDSTRKDVDSLFSSCEDGCRQPTTESLCGLLLRSISQADQVRIVLDALDECNTRKGSWTEGLLLWIRALLDSAMSHVHLLVTSRPEPDIQAVLNDRAREDEVIPIQSELVASDIDAYIHARVRKDNRLNRWQHRPEVQDEIEEKLSEKAHGMYGDSLYDLTSSEIF